MDEASTHSPSEEELESSAGSETFQSAQRLQELDHREAEELASEDDELSDAPSITDSTGVKMTNLGGRGTSASKENDAAEATIYKEGYSAPAEETSASPPLPSRPNKYHGPASTWRNWTAPERDLAASLDQLRAKELNVHLYNAFKLKRRAGDHPAQQDYGDEKYAAKEATWTPPKVWTAWPLPPDVVPREEDGRQWEEEETFSKPSRLRPNKPSETLRELLVAQVLRKAKWRLNAREWGEEDKVATNLAPAIMADDERATEILRSTIQHVLTKLDELLIGLHHARSACLSINEDTEESDLESRERNGLMSTGRGRKRRRKISANNTDFSASSKMLLMTDSDDPMSGKSTSNSRHGAKRPGSYSRNSSKTLQKRKVRLGLRDWSDVLGIASVTGWDSGIVEKAAARCSALFGEGMSFRTLEEAESESYTETTYLRGVSTPRIARKEGQTVNTKKIALIGNLEKENVTSNGVHVDGFLTPIEGKKSWKYGSEGGKRRGRPHKPKK